MAFLNSAKKISLKAFPYLKVVLICVLIASPITTVAKQFLEIRQLVDTDGPFFARWEQNFEPVKGDLPFTHGVIGYIADWDVPGVEYSPANSESEHVLAQYAMSPIVLARGADHEWILANLSEAEFETWFSMQEGEFEVEKYRLNLYLLHRLK